MMSRALPPQDPGLLHLLQPKPKGKGFFTLKLYKVDGASRYPHDKANRNAKFLIIILSTEAGTLVK